MADGSTLPATTRAAPLIAFNELERMAASFARSNMFGAKTEAQALSLLLIGQAEGMHPALAMQEYDIIENKPCRKAERIQARFQLSGGKIKFTKLTDTIVEAEFSHPNGADCTIEWTIERARAIKYRTKEGTKSLADKDNYKNYPRAMLRARTVSEGARTCYPAYAIVTLSTEEAIDMGVVESQVITDEDIAADQPVSGDQLEVLRKAIEETGTDIERFCRYLGVDALPDLRVADFPRATEALAAKKAASSGDAK